MVTVNVDEIIHRGLVEERSEKVNGEPFVLCDPLFAVKIAIEELFLFGQACPQVDAIEVAVGAVL
jgi:hypothetical protein